MERSSRSGKTGDGDSAVRTKLELWRKHLLDLTKRNRLLYFRPGNPSVIPVTNPEPGRVFTELVEREHELTFAMPDPNAPRGAADNQGGTTPKGVTKEIPGDIKAARDVVELQRRLAGLRRAQRTWQEEQGIHILYLAIGALHWREASQSEEEHIAPLVLIPVRLEKERGEKPYRLVPVDEDVTVNPSLAFMLENDFSISIPSITEEPSWGDVQSILASVQKRTASQGWTVTQDMWLTRLSFQKMAMYTDLGEQMDLASSHPITAAIAGSGRLDPPMEPTEPGDLDAVLHEPEAFPVMDTDSSQLEAIVRARNGENLIIHGPPGTGKSQTIVNIIAQLLRDGKKVLFVSEKLAALEVVFRRLRDCGLDEACLELHRHNSAKAKIIEQLAKVLAQNDDITVQGDPEQDFGRLKRRQGDLNRYVRELHAPRGRMNMSAYAVHGELSKLDACPNIDFDIPTHRMLEISAEKLDDWQQRIKRLASERDVWNRCDSHPWRDTTLNDEECSLDSVSRIMSQLQDIGKALSKVEASAKSLSEFMGYPTASCLKEVNVQVEAAAILTKAVDVDTSWVREGSPTNLRERVDRIKDARQQYERLRRARERRAEWLEDSISELTDLAAMLKRYETEYTTFLRFLNGRYRQDRASLRGYLKKTKMRHRDVLLALRLADDVTRLEKGIEKDAADRAQDYGIFFKGASSDWSSIETGLTWSIDLIEGLKKLRLPITDTILARLHDPDNLRADVGRVISDAGDSSTLLAQKLCDIKTYVKTIPAGIAKPQKAQFHEIRGWLEPKNDPNDLSRWISFQIPYAKCVAAGLEPFLKSANESKIKAEGLETAFTKRFYLAWLSEVYNKTPSLREFNGAAHEGLVDEFRSIDRELMGVSAQLALRSIRQRRPNRTSSNSEQSELGILLKEVYKKKRHRPLRRLFSEIPNLLQGLKPCMLMSPLSVATYIPKDTVRFDAVIFDEASQVKPEDAIGAIIRGGQVIVVGDNKQLPPTNFFDRDLDGDDEDEEADGLESLESILDECASTLGFTNAHLNWHYRSQHEELIAFSNRKFYGSRLVTFPGPTTKGTSGAVRFVHLEGATYDRGGSRTNRAEAAKVIELVAAHLKEGKHPGSIGIIALSQSQEDEILRQWESAIIQEPDIEVAANAADPSEPLFIKALEKVQGDERDFIFISVGYGPDQNGQVHLNFGPVNRAGGERRLNVAVTRARKQTTVVSSMLPHQIDVGRLTTQNKGVETLRDYLDYAHRGGVFTEEVTGTGAPESMFEETVREAIEAKGYKVDCQVGVSGFRIDLAVINPDIPSSYILGIECDGATYHSHRLARERDRIRQEVLERLGWRIHRIWSTDWIKNPSHQVSRVVERIVKIRAGGIEPTGHTILRRWQNSQKPPTSDDSQAPSLDQVREVLKGSEQGRDYNMPKYPVYTTKTQLNAQNGIDHLMKRIETLEGMIRDEEKRQNSRSRMGSLRATRHGGPPSSVARSLEKGEDKLARLSDELEELKKDTRKYNSAIRDIVEVEEPIHINVLCDRMHEVCVTAQGGTLTMRPGTLLEFIKEQDVLHVDKGFVSMKEVRSFSITPRAPENGNRPRACEEIHLKELAGAVRWVADAEVALCKEELVKLVARALGYDRTGANVEERIMKAVRYAIDKGLVSENNGQVRGITNG